MTKTKSLVQDALFLTLIIISSKIAIPLAGIAFTLQILIILIVALLSKPFDYLIIIFIYLVMGIIGLPVFSMGGGLSYIYQPSFGFLIGFIIMGPVITLFKNILKKTKINPSVINIIACSIGVLVDYIFGLLYAIFIFNFYLHSNFSLYKILSLIILPFILFDIIKIIIASTISYKLESKIAFLQK